MRGVVKTLVTLGIPPLFAGSDLTTDVWTILTHLEFNVIVIRTDAYHPIELWELLTKRSGQL